MASSLCRVENCVAVSHLCGDRDNSKFFNSEENGYISPCDVMNLAWVSAVPEDPTLAYCKICGKKIRAHKGDIEKHQKTKRHLKKQTTSDILADLIPISCDIFCFDPSIIISRGVVPHHMSGPGLIPTLTGPDGATVYQNLDGTKNNDIESNGDARVVPPTAQVTDGQQQIIYFTESAVDSAHQAANTVIDKLVEKYHQRRLDNLKIEHEAILQLYKDQLLLSQRETQSKVEADSEKVQFDREEHEQRMRCMQDEHSARLKTIEDEHNARLRAIEQELLFAQQDTNIIYRTVQAVQRGCTLANMEEVVRRIHFDRRIELVVVVAKCLVSTIRLSSYGDCPCKFERYPPVANTFTFLSRRCSVFHAMP
ncbi:uncharacterized protein CEXT_342992 [Caerostris extrusa]|uniref:C2H2-type domain-containing protein n=1 Tax=Caerostris extrusa TaxID=172846 RepID=A0AAV4SDN4_CAEEX|nr:uncharacterized protein CEXT_342992 [Caerostris extrusa]